MHFWLRAETKPGERRTPLLPNQCKELIAEGHQVTVERFDNRCIPDADYERVQGVKMAEFNTWKSAAPQDAVILGLKELEEETIPLQHRHIYFAHCYKNQSGWKDVLKRFIDGNGRLFDLEFVRYPDGRRVAAFGFSAGYVGMAVGILAWAHQIQHPNVPLPALEYFNDFKSLYTHCNHKIAEIGRQPKILVVGALGRCGSGAVKSARDAGVPEENILKWDMAETSAGGPFKEMTQVDILCNSIYLSPTAKPNPFINAETLALPDRKLRVIADVSCDPNNPNNPIIVPKYTHLTYLKTPTLRSIEPTESQLPLDVIAIDHLPSVVPMESSMEYSQQLVPHLRSFPDGEVWQSALIPWHEKTKLVCQTLQAEH